MFKTNFFTNLDLTNEVWPDKMPAIPRVGDMVRSRTKWPS